MGAPMLDEAVDLLTVAADTRQHVLKCTTLSLSLYLPVSLCWLLHVSINFDRKSAAFLGNYLRSVERCFFY